VRQMRQMISGVRAKGEPARKRPKPPGRDVRELSFPRRLSRRIFLGSDGSTRCCISRGGRRWPIILTALVVCLCAVPNFFPQERVKTWPLWAQRHIVLGLDLQGGSYLLLEVDAQLRKRSRSSNRSATTHGGCCATAKILYTGLTVRNDAVEIRITKDTELPTALSKLRELSQPLGGWSARAASAAWRFPMPARRLIRLSVPQAAITDLLRRTIEQSIQIVERPR